MLSKFAITSLFMGLMVGTVQAENLTGTMKKIKDTGAITIGVREAFFPFSYLDEKQSYQGYSVDLCLKAIDAIQEELGMNKLEVKMHPVTTSNRISLVADGIVDLSCDTAANNLERQKIVSFAPTMYVAATRLLSKKHSSINSLNDMKGKTVVATTGTGGLREITALNRERNLGIKILTASDHAESFKMVEDGRAEAFVMNDIVMLSLAAHSKNPNDYMLSSEALSIEPYAIIQPKNDPVFKEVVDTALSDLYKSGQINEIYEKWFKKPTPPNGINLNVPISSQLKVAFAKPTDSGDPSTYATKAELQR